MSDAHGGVVQVSVKMAKIFDRFQSNWPCPVARGPADQFSQAVRAKHL